jgi:ring-1,2-phenylacetyl-CoA epoxidase subunit PaaC
VSGGLNAASGGLNAASGGSIAGLSTAVGTGAGRTEPGAAAAQAHHATVLRLGDSCLVLAQRLSQWCGHGPMLEEDIALTNVSLDLLGQARLLLSHAGALEGRGRSEDDLAYFRDEAQFFNWTMVELPNGAGPHEDYALTIARNAMVSALLIPLWEGLAASTDAQLAAIAAKSVKEARAHWRHASEWLIRMGDGTPHSQARAQAALDRLWPYANEWWQTDVLEQQAAQAGIMPTLASLKPQWMARMQALLDEATLQQPPPSGFISTGKQGEHSEHLGFLLAEMQSLARKHPGVQW